VKSHIQPGASVSIPNLGYNDVHSSGFPTVGALRAEVPVTPAFDELRDRLTIVRIAHHIGGRIRLTLEADPTALSISDRPPTQLRVSQLRVIVDRIPGFRSVRVNVLARSCTVEYDPTVIPDRAWSDFLAGTDSPAAAVLERILRETYQEITHAEL
jgi:hypothetical protein